MYMSKHSVLILAAGNASRFGSPKQLLVYNNKTFIRRIADEAIKAFGTSLVVVTGAHAELIETEIADLTFVRNEAWQDGMGSSISKGMTSLMDLYSDSQDVIILVCDQPHVSADLLLQIKERRQSTGKRMIACAYNNTIGTPAFFDKYYFNELSALNGQQGAKVLFQKYPDDVATIDFPSGHIDIDTTEDYERLIQSV
jgi:molybdenum cofactor cytidylyltransferase